MISNESVNTILTEKRDYAKVIRARVCVYRARVLDTASRNASSRVSRSNILETRSKRARKKRIVSAGRYCSCLVVVSFFIISCMINDVLLLLDPVQFHCFSLYTLQTSSTLQ